MTTPPRFKIAVIVPYFGKLPECFPAWRASALRNPMIEFWLFTDDKRAEGEGNLKVEHVTFEAFKQRIQAIFDFPIECRAPYKLCDFKPVYGEVFRERLKEYDFWGYCDVDLVFGDIGRFLTDEVLESHDKILVEAHISLFKNTPRMNSLFRDDGPWPEYNQAEALGETSLPCYFDEFWGMELKCLRNGIRLWRDCNRLDANPQNPRFEKEGRQVVALWEDGRLFLCGKDRAREEIMYAHVSKRPMRLEWAERTLPIKRMAIVPGTVFCNDLPDTGTLFGASSGGIFHPVRFKLRQLGKRFVSASPLRVLRRELRRRAIEEQRRKAGL